MVLINAGDNTRTVAKSAYKDEAELQKYLFDYPDLLKDDEEEEVLSVKREVDIEAGRIDVLSVTKGGTIIATEVKLAKNRQSRREVVAQIIDYISELSALSYYALDEIVENKLSAQIDSIETEADLPRVIDTSLKGGLTRIVIAVDDANDGLIRMLDFLAEHSYFDIRLVAIEKYQIDNTIQLFPRTIIKNKNAGGGDKPGEPSPPDFEAIIDKWNAGCREQYPKAVGTEGRYRQIKFPAWPAALHYEFVYMRSGMYVRLDNEGGSRKQDVNEALERFDGTVLPGGKKITFAQSARGGGNQGSKLWIKVLHADDDEVCRTMSALIDATQSEIDAIYR